MWVANEDTADIIQCCGPVPQSDEYYRSLEWLSRVAELMVNSSPKFEENSIANLQLCKELGIHNIKGAIKGATIELFRLWKGAEDEEEEEEEDAEQKGMDCRDEEREKVQEHLANFHNLGWINLYSKEMMEAVHQEIGKHVKRRCQGEFEEKLLPVLQHWLQDTMLPFAKMIMYTRRKVDNVNISASSLAAMLTNEKEGGSLEQFLWPTLSLSALKSFALLHNRAADIMVEFPIL